MAARSALAPGTATKSGNVLQLRNLARCAGRISRRDDRRHGDLLCDGTSAEWALTVKSGGSLSGDTLSRKPGTVAPKTSRGLVLPPALRESAGHDGDRNADH